MPGQHFGTIRRCTPADAPVLAELGARLFREAYGTTHPEPDLTPYLAQTFDPRQLATELAQPEVCVLFALDASHQAIGYGYARASDAARPASVPGLRPWEILRFYVDAQWQGRGVAAPLFAACTWEARQQGADAIWLAVWQEASRPQAFYRRMGLEVVGTTVFKFGQRRDADFVLAMPLHPPEMIRRRPTV
ncbi:MAG: GNAT family N-acetyltransferase [Gemmatimonadales bacterium]